jgi:hypothetical protein
MEAVECPWDKWCKDRLKYVTAERLVDAYVEIAVEKVKSCK